MTETLIVGQVSRGIFGGWTAEAGEGWYDYSERGLGWSARAADFMGSGTLRGAKFWVESCFANEVADTTFTWRRVSDDRWECAVVLPVLRAERCEVDVEYRVDRDGGAYRARCSIHGSVGSWRWPSDRAHEEAREHLAKKGEPRV